MKSKSLALCLAASASIVFCAPAADADTFSVLTYNVRGLPAVPPFVEDRTAEIAAITPLLEDFHNAGGQIDGIPGVVGIQELFDATYYATITGGVAYANETAKDSSGDAGIGDGLTDLSDFALTGYTRETWNMCFGTFGQNGSDCDTAKGLSYGSVEVAPGAFVDVYNFHADAGQDEGSRTARRDNIAQLVAAINTNSPPGTAVIVVGDTNSRYTRTPNDNIETLLSGAGVTDVWVELVNGGAVPGAGPDIESGCETTPEGSTCELIDKIFYRSGTSVTLMPTEYNVYNDEFFLPPPCNPGTHPEECNMSDHFPVSAVFDVTVDSGTTTSSTTSSTVVSTTVTLPPTTSTTMGGTSTTSTTMDSGGGVCGDPVGDAPTFGVGAAVTASDALFILSASIGSQQCALCVCDVNNSGGTTATDALAVLRAAVGQPVTLVCPPC